MCVGMNWTDLLQVCLDAISPHSVCLRNPRAINKEDDRSSVSGNKLRDLLSFLHSKVDGEKRISLVKAGFMLSGDVLLKKNWKKLVQEMAAKAVYLFSNEKKTGMSCLFCKTSR